MKKEILFWDKKTPINGVEATEILKDAFFRNARKLFLLKDSVSGLITNIESVDVIKSTLELSADTPDSDVPTKYVQYLEDLEKQTEEEANQVQPMMARMATGSGVDLNTLAEQLDRIETKLDVLLKYGKPLV